MEETTTIRLEPVFISITDVISLLHTGFTRRIGDNNYNPEIGSIQERYGLSTEEVVDLFRDPRLKNQKMIVPKVSRIVILEDVPADVVTVGPVTDATDTELSEEWPTGQILDITVDNTNLEVIPNLDAISLNAEAEVSFETEQETTW